MGHGTTNAAEKKAVFLSQLAEKVGLTWNNVTYHCSCIVHICMLEIKLWLIFCSFHRTIFEVDVDSFEEKPWKLPGIDVSDFFNFSMNEDSWKGYCKQLVRIGHWFVLFYTGGS